MKRSDFIKRLSVLGASAVVFQMLPKEVLGESVLKMRAYPDPLPTTGPLSLSDALEYFIEAMLDSGGWNAESWPRFAGNDFFAPSSFADGFSRPTTPDISFPATREKFYEVIDSWTEGGFYVEENSNNLYSDYFGRIGGAPLYTFATFGSNWPVKAVNDWAKIKCIELGLFGSVGNGSNLTDTSIVGSGTWRTAVGNIKIGDLQYLRYALTKFDTYGTTNDDSGGFQLSPPSGLSVNLIARSFSFTYASGITTPSRYEYSINGGGWVGVTGNPQSVLYLGKIPTGGLALRTRPAEGAVYDLPSVIINNTTEYPAVTANLTLSYEIMVSAIRFKVEILDSEDPLDTTIVISLSALANGSPIFTDPLVLEAGELSGYIDYPGEYSSASILSASASPTVTNNGRPINLIY